MRLATKVTMTLYCTSYDSVRHAAMHALNFVDAYHCCENGNDMVCVLIQTRTSVWQKSSDEVWFGGSPGQRCHSFLPISTA